MEFAYNNSLNSATGTTPFYAYVGSHPQLSPGPWTTSTNPDAEARINSLRQNQEDICAALELAQATMKKAHDVNRLPAPEYKEGDLVWLRADNIWTSRPAKKLDHRLLGPFRIQNRLSDHAYRLKLLPSMKVHPVFHTQLLEPHSADTIPGRVRPAPEPVTIDSSKEEYEVEDILDCRRRHNTFDYLVKWKGYSPADNTWEPWQHVANAEALVCNFHRRHPTAPGPRRYLP